MALPEPDKYKKDLSDFIRELRESNEIDFILSRQLYPTTEAPSKFYGLPEVHKPNMLDQLANLYSVILR